jgi:hypothetical protein
MSTLSPTRQTEASTNHQSSAHSQKKVSSLSLDDITPEIAAHVVRNYLLPMFESDVKKGLRLKSVRGATGGTKNQGQSSSPNKDSNIGAVANNSVYGELKLSEKL